MAKTTRKRGRKFACTAVLMALVVCGVGCGSGDDDTAEGTTGGTDGDPIVLEALLSLTGRSQVFGTQEQEGAEFAVEEINDAGGIDGRPLELRVTDDKTDPAVGVQEMRRILSEDEAVGLVGPTNSGVAVAVKPLAEEGKIPFIAPVSSRDMAEPPRDYAFQNFTIDVNSTQAVLKFLADKGATRIALLTGEDAFGEGAIASFEEYADQEGVEIVATVTYAPESTSMSNQVLQADEEDPEAWLAWDSSVHLSTLLQNIRDVVGPDPMIMTPPIGGSDDIQDVAGEAGDGIYYTAQLAQDDPRPGVQAEFVERWRAAKGSDPADGHELGYNMIELYAEAMRRLADDGEDITRDTVRDSLETLSDFETVYGTITYSADKHDPIDPDQVQINQVLDGKRVRAD